MGRSMAPGTKFLIMGLLEELEPRSDTGIMHLKPEFMLFISKDLSTTLTTLTLTFQTPNGS